MFEKVKKYVLEPAGDPINNIVKALLLGFIAGLIFGLVGEEFDFNLHRYNSGWDFTFYGIIPALIGGIIVSGFLFLKYNQKEK